MAKMLVLGDSIQWGQGLADGDKIAERVAAIWRAKDPTLTVTRFAHSGADVWSDAPAGTLAALDPRPPPFPAAFDVSNAQIEAQQQHSAADAAARNAVGEIPDKCPFLLCQILDAAKVAGSDFDLVLVDAGINDTELYNLLLPGKDQEAVVRRGQSFRPRVERVLRLLRATFPAAKVIVTGYYPVVSEQSDTLRLLPLWRKVAEAALEEGVAEAKKLLALVEKALLFGGAPGEGLKPIPPLAPFAEELGARGYEWTRALHAAIEQAISDVDAANIRFADPEFGPEHSIFAEESLVWGIDDHGRAMDPCAGKRADYCKDKGIIGFKKLVTCLASMGHPTKAGAQRYADAVIARAHELALF